jgi:DNA (cytosine-5)-methyltransferase 1
MKRKVTRKPRFASFFAGIGGFDLGFEQAKFDVAFQCEIQTFCKSVLKHHWPTVTLADDITQIEPEDIPDAEVWCGGFPCQDLSVARGAKGRNGLNGSRSGLFFRLSALAKVKRPQVILIENVHGLLNSNEGRDFSELLHTLNSLNYAVSWRLLNSRYFGVPQSRPRMYICAWMHNPVAAGNVLFESQAPARLFNERAAFLNTSWKGGLGPIPPKLAFCLAATSGRHTGTDWSRTYIPYMDEVRRLTPLECERLQGFPDNWTKLHLSDIDLERSDSLRYHALGNAVSVTVVKWIATRISDQLGTIDSRSKSKKDTREFFTESVERWPGLNSSKIVSGRLTGSQASETRVIWPNSGISWNNEFIGNTIHPSPCSPLHADLINLVECEKPDSRYFLSPNAAEGILRRVDSQNRHLFPYLRTALERLSGRHLDTGQDIRIPLQREMFEQGSPIQELVKCV